MNNKTYIAFLDGQIWRESDDLRQISPPRDLNEDVDRAYIYNRYTGHWFQMKKDWPFSARKTHMLERDEVPKELQAMILLLT